MMHLELDLAPKTLDEQCDLLEGACELAVQAHVSEIDAAPEKTIPCCVKCGELRFLPRPHMQGVRNAPLTDAQRAALEHTVAHGHPTPTELSQIDGVLAAHPMGLRIQGVAELMRRKLGSTVDIAVFQCAQERRRGKDCFVAIDFDDVTGNLHAYVKYKDGAIKNPQDDTVPGEHACGCGGKHETAAPGGDDG